MLKSGTPWANRIGIIILLFVWGMMGVGFLSGNKNDVKPAPIEQLTPEQTAQREQRRKEDNERQKKIAREARASSLMAAIGISRELLNGAEIDLKQGRLASMDMQGIGAMLEVIYTTASSLQVAWSDRYALSQGDINTLKYAEAQLKEFQRKGLPQMRLAFKKQVAATLWEHDVVVRLGGSGNTKITLISFQFAANANIKSAHEQLSELLKKLRFKQVEYITDDYTYHGSGYDLQTPVDTAIAVYAGEFKSLDRGKPKP